MSRPKPTIILEHIDKATYKCEQVLKADAIGSIPSGVKTFLIKDRPNAITNYLSSIKVSFPT